MHATLHNVATSYSFPISRACVSHQIELHTQMRNSISIILELILFEVNCAHTRKKHRYNSNNSWKCWKKTEKIKCLKNADGKRSILKFMTKNVLRWSRKMIKSINEKAIFVTQSIELLEKRSLRNKNEHQSNDNQIQDEQNVFS